MGAHDIIPRALALDSTEEVYQNIFNMPSLNIYLKHVKLPSWEEEDLRGITGLEEIENSFKVFNIQEYLYINKIGSTSSRQEIWESRKSALSYKPNFPAVNSYNPPEQKKSLPKAGDITIRTN